MGAERFVAVTIGPQGAIDAGAQWRVDGRAMAESGDTQTDLSVGGHTVEFSDVVRVGQSR